MAAHRGNIALEVIGSLGGIPSPHVRLSVADGVVDKFLHAALFRRHASLCQSEEIRIFQRRSEGRTARRSGGGRRLPKQRHSQPNERQEQYGAGKDWTL